jgi:hypothetical protein
MKLDLAKVLADSEERNARAEKATPKDKWVFRATERYWILDLIFGRLTFLKLSPDMAFIVHSRADVPASHRVIVALVARVRELEEENGRN